MGSGILVCTLADDVECTVLILTLNLHRVEVHGKCDRLVGYFLQRVLDGLCLNAEAGIHFAFNQVDMRNQGGLAVAGRNGHALPVDVKQVAIQNGEGVLAVKNTLDGGEAAEEGRTCNF